MHVATLGGHFPDTSARLVQLVLSLFNSFSPSMARETMVDREMTHFHAALAFLKTWLKFKPAVRTSFCQRPLLADHSLSHLGKEGGEERGRIRSL